MQRSSEPPAVIEVEQLSKIYRVPKKAPGLLGSLRSLVRREHLEVAAVADVSFRLTAGELVGFLGPNGAGKTTTLKVLAGLLHPSGGRVAVLGHQPWRRETALLRQFSLVLGQKNQLWWDLPALESFRLNAEIYGVPRAELRTTLDEPVDLLELEPVLGVQVRKLSLGERMKCELAAALLPFEYIYAFPLALALGRVGGEEIWRGLALQALWTGRINNIAYLIMPIMDLGRVPTDVFSGPLRPFFTFVLPIALIVTVPTRVLLGLLDSAVALYAPVLATALLFLANRFWRVSLRRYSSASS